MQFLPNYRSCVGFVCTTLCISTVLQMLPWVVIVQAFHQIVYNASKMHSIVMIYRPYWMQYIISSYLTQCNQYCSFKSDCTECNDISKRVLSSPIRPPHLRSCKGLSSVTCTFFQNASFNSSYFFNWNLTARISYRHQPAFPWIFLVHCTLPPFLVAVQC